jgi:hypothetical protein
MEPRIYTDGIPRGHATNETWKCHRRQAAKGVKPRAYFKPPDYVPEFYGCPLGIPLFTPDQTTAYNPTAATVAGQKYYDFFVASQNRRRLSVWFFPDWRWAYSIRRDDLTGVHVIGLLPNLSRMDVIKAELHKTLAYLEEEALERLRPFKNPKIPDDQFAPLTGSQQQVIDRPPLNAANGCRQAA